MIEGFPPFNEKEEREVPDAYAAKERPPFRAPPKHYTHGIKELIVECWNENPAKRPTFRQIIVRLEGIHDRIGHKRNWKIGPLKCFQNLDWKKDHGSLSSRSRSARSTSSI